MWELLKAFVAEVSPVVAGIGMICAGCVGVYRTLRSQPVRDAVKSVWPFRTLMLVSAVNLLYFYYYIVREEITRFDTIALAISCAVWPFIAVVNIGVVIFSRFFEQAKAIVDSANLTTQKIHQGNPEVRPVLLSNGGNHKANSADKAHD